MASGLETKLCPRFFRIILEEALRKNKLRVPRKIVSKCGGSLKKDRVFLKLPCGSQWKVGLTKSSDGAVWIKKGWPEFSKHYSIALGHLLIFTYQGNSEFQVFIFDTTTTEIDYPSIVHKQVKRETKSPLLQRSKGLKRVRISTRHDIDDVDSTHSCEAASKFFSTNPYFSVALGRSYRRKGPLHIPSAFGHSHIEHKTQMVMLKVGERCWTVKMLAKQRGRLKWELSSGWAVFSTENALSMNDVCIFELVKTTEPLVMKVSIFRQSGPALT